MEKGPEKQLNAGEIAEAKRQLNEINKAIEVLTAERDSADAAGELEEAGRLNDEIAKSEEAKKVLEEQIG